MIRFRPAPAVLLGALFLLAAAAAFARAHSQTPSEASSRPVVLMLHGRGVHSQDTATLRRVWLEAMNAGLVAVGGRALLGEDDLRLIWYADALDPRAPVACPTAATAIGSPGLVREISSAFGAVGALLGLIAEWTGEHEGEALRSVAGDLLYLGDGGKRCAAEQRLADALEAATGEGRPVVLVAHSFGSLVAFSHLTRRPGAEAPRVERYVTIGSLVGRPELRQLLLEGAHGAAPPEGVASWVNVRDPLDPFAARLGGFETFPGSAQVIDLITELPHSGDPHDAGRYLSDPATGRAVLGAWCTGLGEESGAEPACGAERLIR